MSDADQLFAAKEFSTVEDEALAVYEAQTGVALAEADPRRMHLRSLLLFLWQQRGLIDIAGRTSLLRDIAEPYIEAFAEWMGESKIAADAATVTVRLSWSAPDDVYYYAAGKRVSLDGYLWECEAIAKAGGDTTTDVLATCTTAGEEPNGIAPTDCEMADPLPYLDGVQSVTQSAGGTPEETTEEFRTRLRTAPNSWAVAGPREAYEALARGVSTAIIDVRALARRDNADLAGSAVDPGTVRLMVLAYGGASAALLGDVEDACTAETKQPFTDALEVTTPEDEGTAVDLSITGTYYIGQSNAGESESIQAAVAAAFLEYMTWQTGEFGRDINPDKLRAVAVVAGAKRLDLGAFLFQALAIDEVAVVPAAIADLEIYSTAVGDGVATVTVAAGQPPALGDYWLICSSAADGADPAVFQLFRKDPASPTLVAEVDADGASHNALGLDVTITVGGTPWSVFDLWTFTVGPVPTLTFGGIEAD